MRYIVHAWDFIVDLMLPVIDVLIVVTGVVMAFAILATFISSR